MIADRHSLKRVLFDFREADTTATTTVAQIYESTKVLRKYYPVGTEFAVVNTVTETVDKTNKKFFEDVALTGV